MAERTVNARQLEVLRWIGDGCPEGRWPEGDFTYKTTAAALQGRRLVTVSKKKGVWAAVPTEAGHHFIRHGAYPEGHWAAKESRPTTPHSSAPYSPAPKKPSTARVTGLRPSDQFIADLIAAGGSLRFETDENNYYENLANTAYRYGKVPDGKLISISREGWYGPKTIAIVDKPEWMTKVLDPIPVPDTLTKPHPAVAAIRADKEHRLRFKQPVRHRALLLLQAIAKEATERGYTVQPAAARRDNYGRSENPKWDMRITVPYGSPSDYEPLDRHRHGPAPTGHEYELLVTEDTDKTPHTPSKAELARAARPYGTQPPKYDHTPSGRLNIAVLGGSPVRQSSFGDTKTLNLNDRLANVLQEVELRADEAEKRRIAEAKAQAERVAQWENVRAQAALDYAEDYKRRVLEARAARWRERTQLAQHVTALAEHIDAMPDEEQAAAREWLAWATAHIKTNPPFAKTGMPDIPDPKADDLKPFMRGLNPHGPTDRWGQVTYRHP